MYAPACDDERTTYVKYVNEQLDAIRASAIGLTDEQARMRPCRSALSIAGLIKHATYVMRGTTERLAGEVDLEQSPGPERFAVYEASFTLADGETAADALAAFDVARVEYVAAIGASDPAAQTTQPPAPWYGIFDARPSFLRYTLGHQVEELARHAGHADIIREQIDGVAVPQIVLSEAGAPANDFFQPYVAAPGTIGAH
ncbi:MAG TPA: DinB family protein [Acidimicrobiales bacterium]|nr:DinB family protein [Acidimicrobiales bacterium]